MATQNKRGEGTATGNRENITNIVDSLRRIVKALRSSSRESERTLGISSAQLQILQELQDRPSQSVSQLASRTYTHQSSVSMVVKKLVESRLVTRSPSRSDARKVLISATSAGRALLKKSPTTAQGRIVTALRGLPRGDLLELAHGLETLTRLLDDDAVAAQRKNGKAALEA